MASLRQAWDAIVDASLERLEHALATSPAVVHATVRTPRRVLPVRASPPNAQLAREPSMWAHHVPADMPLSRFLSLPRGRSIGVSRGRHSLPLLDG